MRSAWARAGIRSSPQSGEEYQGRPLHDRQHPHDAFMELGASYRRPLTGDVGFSLYAAPVGEPALGPTAFIMRPSAMDNPVAPIGHHWQDATHVSFGVVTAGLFTKRWTLEAIVGSTAASQTISDGISIRSSSTRGRGD